MEDTARRSRVEGGRWRGEGGGVLFRAVEPESRARSREAIRSTSSAAGRAAVDVRANSGAKRRAVLPERPRGGRAGDVRAHGAANGSGVRAGAVARCVWRA